MNGYAETYGLILFIILVFIPPFILRVIFQILRYPSFELRNSVSFALGWIPGNLLACGYFVFSELPFGIKVCCDFLLLFVYVEAFQVGFIYILYQIIDIFTTE